MNAALDVKLRIGEGAVKLGQLRELTDNLQRTLGALASQLADTARPGIDFEIVEAAVGSLSLSLRAVAEEGAAIEPERVVATFTADLAEIRKQHYRADLTPDLTRRYRALVTCFKDMGAVVEYRYGRDHVLVDDAFRQGFRGRRSEGASGRGRRGRGVPRRGEWTPARRIGFSCTPSSSERTVWSAGSAWRCWRRSRVFLKKTVKVEGTGHFAPVGIYPLRMDVKTKPRPLTWDPALLRGYVGKLTLVPKGMTASDYLERNREAAGLADYGNVASTGTRTALLLSSTLRRRHLVQYWMRYR